MKNSLWYFLCSLELSIFPHFPRVWRSPFFFAFERCNRFIKDGICCWALVTENGDLGLFNRSSNRKWISLVSQYLFVCSSLIQKVPQWKLKIRYSFVAFLLLDELACAGLMSIEINNFLSHYKYNITRTRTFGISQSPLPSNMK